MILNLPGQKDHDPSKSWFYKLNEDTKIIAVDGVTFVDEVRDIA